MKFYEVVGIDGRVTHVNPLRVAYVRKARENETSSPAATIIAFEATMGGLHSLTTLQPLEELLTGLEEAAAAHPVRMISAPVSGAMGSAAQGPRVHPRARSKAS